MPQHAFNEAFLSGLHWFCYGLLDALTFGCRRFQQVGISWRCSAVTEVVLSRVASCEPAIRSSLTQLSGEVPMRSVAFVQRLFLFSGV